MNNFIVCFDLDNVCNNHMERTLETYNSKYNTSLTLDDFPEYDIYKDLPYDEAQNFISLFSDKDVLTSLKPREKAQWGIKKLMEDGATVYLATSTPYKDFAYKVEFIKKYFPFIPEKNIILIHNKGLLKCDVLIDDFDENLLANKWCYRVLFDACWNKAAHDEAFDFRRVHNWEEIVEEVNKIYEEEYLKE